MPGSRSRRQETVSGWLFALPALLGFFALTLVPMAVSLFLSLTNYPILSTPQFTGLENYRRLFSGEDPFFYKSLQVTFAYVFLAVPAGVVFAFLLALALNRKVPGRSVFRTIFYLPVILPTVATSIVWSWLMNPDFGLFNQILSFLGLPTSTWMYGEDSVIASMALMSVWGTGGMMLIFLSGLEEIPQTYYEALEVDGGNAWHKLWYVTIPLCSPTIFFNSVLAIIGAFQIFAQAYIITQGGPNNGSLFYVFYLFREAFQNLQMGSASAIAWVLFVIILIFTAITFRSSALWVYYEGEKKAK